MVLCSRQGGLACAVGNASNPAAVLVDSCTVSNALATGSGGAVFATTSVQLVNTTVSMGQASEDGGALLFRPSVPTATAVVSSCRFDRCTASGGRGGALSLFGGSTIVQDCTFVNGAASNQGGALHVASAATCVVGNSTASGACALYNVRHVTRVTDGVANVYVCMCTGNVASTMGGFASVVDRGELAIADCSVTASHAAAAGGGLAVTDSATLVVTSSHIRRGSANAGGGIHASLASR